MSKVGKAGGGARKLVLAALIGGMTSSWAFAQDSTTPPPAADPAATTPETAASPSDAPVASAPGSATTTPEAVAEVAKPAASGSTAAAPAELDTLQKVVAKVWRDNPLVRQAEQALSSSGYDITAARSGYLPYAQIQSSLAEKSQDGVSTLYVILPLWSGGRTNAQVDVAKAKQQAALANLARTRFELGQRTIDAYFAVAQSQDEAIQWRNYIGALNKLLATIKRRADQGLAPQADVETAVSRLKLAQASAESNRARLLTNRAVLASLLNATPGSLAWPEDAFILGPAEIAEANKNIEKHPTYLAARAQLEQQKGTARGARASLSPEVSLQHRQQLEGTKFDPSNDATLLVLSYQTNNGVQGLFGWRAEKQRIDAAKAQVESAHREVESAIEVDRATLNAVTAQLSVQYEAAQAANSLVQSFIRQFEGGRKSWLEVLNSQREANDSLVQSISLRRGYWQSNARFALDAMYWDRLGATVIEDAAERSE